MKYKYLTFFVFTLLSCNTLDIENMAIYVPNTNTFTLQNVVDAVEDHAGDISDNLDTCFDYAISTYFDTDYNNNTYAPANSMKRFRNYGPSGNTIVVPDGFSPNGDGIHDYFEIENLIFYPDHKMSIFFSPGGTLIYSREGDYVMSPWDGKYNGNFVSAGTYYWVLEINGSVYDTGSVMVAY